MKYLQILINVDSIEFGKASFIYFNKESKSRSYFRLEEFVVTNELKLSTDSVFEIKIFYKNVLYTELDFTLPQGVNFINQETIELYTDLDPKHLGPKHYNYDQDLIDILRKWEEGETFNWRPLKTKAKRTYLKACLFWSGLPRQPIPYKNYVLDGAEVKYEVDFYCLLGEVFFGERGYFGQDPDGFDDCFNEIYSYKPHKAVVEPNTIVTIKNATQLEKVLNRYNKNQFFYIIEIFKKDGFIVKLFPNEVFIG